MQLEHAQLCNVVSECVVESLLQVCGGSVSDENGRRRLQNAAVASLSFPNNRNDSEGGKAQDIEIRIALTLFHRWKREMCSDEIEIVSDFGIVRTVTTPHSLAQHILLPLETACRRRGIAHDVRVHPSGVIGIVTIYRSVLLRRAGKLPCPLCVKWCQGEKGLRRHQQGSHQVEYSTATALAASSTDGLAIIPYDPNIQKAVNPFCGERLPMTQLPNLIDPLDIVKSGDLAALRDAVAKGYVPSRERDTKGSSPIIWAAGSGHLHVVRYLVEECSCDPAQQQVAKRSFGGRTPLHWAARNGHLPVVKYLVGECHVDIEMATSDGTTAFCWASWQGHLPIMEYLAQSGCNLNSNNVFGCNAVLWNAQGEGSVLTMAWLQSKGCKMTKINNNGHGVLHKAAQRGNAAVCEWFFENWILPPSGANGDFKLVGPDTENYCPSDLAGMEGNDGVARTVATLEVKYIENLLNCCSSLPSWLIDAREEIATRISDKEWDIWERFGGIRRMRSCLSKGAENCRV